MITKTVPEGPGEAGTVRKGDFNNLFPSTLFLHAVIKILDRARNCLIFKIMVALYSTLIGTPVA